MSWIADKVFNNVDDFIVWLDQNFGDYISKSISENHVHHTYKPDHSNYPKYTTLQLHKNMRSFHVNTNDWDDIAQNITIGKDGDIVTGRDIRKIPISAKGYNGIANWHPFAYEMIGNFDKGNDPLEGKQLDAAIKISSYFHNKKGKAIKFHRELLINGKQPKSCPGTGIDKTWFMNWVNKTEVKLTAQSVSAQSAPLDSADGKLIRGERGKNVQQLNLWLKELEYTTKTDDFYDQYTDAAFRVFLKTQGLSEDTVYTSPIGDLLVKAIADKKNQMKVDAIPTKNPVMYRMAKYYDTTNQELIKELKAEGFRLIEAPSK